MFTLKTGKAAHQQTPQGSTVLAVPFEIISADDEVVQSLTETFPLSATTPEIQETLARHLEVFTQDFSRYETAKEHQAALDASAEVAGEISNITL